MQDQFKPRATSFSSSTVTVKVISSSTLTVCCSGRIYTLSCIISFFRCNGYFNIHIINSTIWIVNFNNSVFSPDVEVFGLRPSFHLYVEFDGTHLYLQCYLLHSIPRVVQQSYALLLVNTSNIIWIFNRYINWNCINKVPSVSHCYITCNSTTWFLHQLHLNSYFLCFDQS